MSQQLRKYQGKALEDLRAVVREGFKSSVLVCPTGGGKTTIAAALIEGAVGYGRRIGFIAHRKELIDQCSKRLDEQGIDHGIIKAGNKRRNSLPVQVCSIQTLINRVRPKENDQLALLRPRYEFDILIIDECHRAQAATYRKVVEAFPNAFVLGLTATPFRTDGRGLGDLFSTLVLASSPAELTEMGFLVPARVFTTPLNPDFSKLHRQGGDVKQDEAEAAMDKATLIGDIYENWKRHASDRQTVIFASGRRHALHILEQFTEKGERIAYVDGDTPEFERDEKLSRLASGALQLIVNVGILTEGWDCPSVSCVVLARITESCGLYLQMIGRILRTLAGEDGWPKERWHLRKKRDGIILDHGGNTIRHGFVTDEREYDLHGNHKRPKEDIAPITTCQKCFAVFSNLPACPACGGVNEGRQAATADRKDPEQKDGTLQEVNREEVRQAEIRFFHEKLAEQTHRGYKPGYAKKCFFDKFGRWPGKEIGVKTTWEEQRDEQGKRRFKPKGFKFQDIEVHVGG